MKNILSLIFAGVIGGVITLGGFYFYESTVAIDNPQPLQTSFILGNAQGTLKPAPLDFRESASIAMPTVVHIKASESNGQTQFRRNQEGRSRENFLDFFFDAPFGSPFGGGPKEGKGSGVIISADGYIVTNKHVVDFADDLEVTLYDDRTYKASKVGVDPRTDLAVIKVDAKNLPFIEFANSNKAQVGEWVLAVGNPFDLTSTVTAGIISAKGRSIGVIRDNQAIENFIQTDAVVNPGNSGGALVDLDGRLVGINTAIATPTGTFAGYSFAIPSNMVMDITNNIIEYGGPRAMLGIEVRDIDEDLMQERSLSVDQGVYIEAVTDGGAAQYAGLLPRDIITRVDGLKVDDAQSLIEIVGKARVGETIELTINRDGRTRKISVTLKAG